MVKIALRVTMPDELMQPFLQAISDFGHRFDPDNKMHLEILGDAANFPSERLAAMFQTVFPKTWVATATKKVNT